MSLSLDFRKGLLLGVCFHGAVEIRVVDLPSSPDPFFVIEASNNEHNVKLFLDPVAVEQLCDQVLAIRNKKAAEASIQSSESKEDNNMSGLSS